MPTDVRDVDVDRSLVCGEPDEAGPEPCEGERAAGRQEGERGEAGRAEEKGAGAQEQLPP